MNEETFGQLMATIWRAFQRKNADPSPANHFRLVDAVTRFEKKLGLNVEKFA